MARELKLETVSPFLQHSWNEYFAKSGDTVTALAIRAELSYGYALKCVTGRVIPKQKALKALCDAAHLDYTDTWQKLQQEQGGFSMPLSEDTSDVIHAAVKTVRKEGSADDLVKAIRNLSPESLKELKEFTSRLLKQQRRKGTEKT